MHWFWFLIDPQLDATNWRPKQAIRPAVVNRKVWGGNRTWVRAAAQAILVWLLAALAQRGPRAAGGVLGRMLRRRAAPVVSGPGLYRPPAHHSSHGIAPRPVTLASPFSFRALHAEKPGDTARLPSER